MGLNLVGFIIKYDDLMKLLCIQTKPEVYCYEDRYDPITGQKTTPFKKLQSCAQYEYKLGSEILLFDEDDPDSLYKILGDKLDAEVVQQFGEDNVFITVPVKTVGKGVSCGRVSFGPHLSYDSVIEAAPRIKQLGEKLIEFGFKPGPPLIIMNTTIA